MLHCATEKVSMHLIGRICSIRRFDFSSIIVEQLYISERKKKSCIRNRTQRTLNPPFLGETAIIINCLKTSEPL